MTGSDSDDELYLSEDEGAFSSHGFESAITLPDPRTQKACLIHAKYDPHQGKYDKQLYVSDGKYWRCEKPTHLKEVVVQEAGKDKEDVYLYDNRGSGWQHYERSPLSL